MANGFYCKTSDVQLRIGGFANFTIDANSKPSLTDTETLIADAEAELHTALRQAGATVIPATDGTDIAFLRGKVADYVTAQVFRIAFGWDNLPDGMQTAIETWPLFIGQVRSGMVGLLASGQPQVNRMKRVSIWLNEVNTTDG